MPRKRLATTEDVLEVLENWIARKGHPPTIKELQEELEVGSTRTVLRYLEELETEGLIRRWPGARGIQLLRRTDTGIATTRVPLVGEAPAGSLMLAEENLEGWIRMPQSVLRPPGSRFFLLRVRGDSMNRASVQERSIESGDLVLVRQEPVAESGQIVVVLVDGQATIKRLVEGPGYWILKPESTNSEHKPIVLTDDFRVQGLVVQVLKRGAVMLQDLYENDASNH